MACMCGDLHSLVERVGLIDTDGICPEVVGLVHLLQPPECGSEVEGDAQLVAIVSDGGDVLRVSPAVGNGFVSLPAPDGDLLSRHSRVSELVPGRSSNEAKCIGRLRSRGQAQGRLLEIIAGGWRVDGSAAEPARQRLETGSCWFGPPPLGMEMSRERAKKTVEKYSNKRIIEHGPSLS